MPNKDGRRVSIFNETYFYAIIKKKPRYIIQHK